MDSQHVVQSEPSPPAQDTLAGSDLTGAASDRDCWPKESWRTSSPEEQGMDSARLEEGVMGIRHCEEANRIYLITYAVTPETAVKDVLAALAAPWLPGLS
jgi:hypothetical protein